MTALRWAAVLGLLIGGSLVWWSLGDTGPLTPKPDSGAKSSVPKPEEGAATGDSARGPTPQDRRVPRERTASTMEEPSTEPVTPDPSAVASLRRGREQGEPRTPPLVENSPLRELPTDEELADPELYLEYEGRQKQQVLASFLKASERKTNELKAAIERAESEGMPEAQLEEGREKLRRLEAMREQLLRDYPELAPAADASGGQDAPASP